MKERIASAFLILALIMSLCPIQVGATETSEEISVENASTEETSVGESFVEETEEEDSSVEKVSTEVAKEEKDYIVEKEETTEKETEIESETQTEEEAETETETEPEEETETETEALAVRLALDREIVSGSISLDGDLSDWDKVTQRSSYDSYIAYWKAAFDEAGNFYFCFTGTATTEWDSNYQWKNIGFVKTYGTDTRQMSGDWGVSSLGGSVVFANEAHQNTAGPYYVEGMIPSSYFDEEIYAVVLAENNIPLSDIQQMDGNASDMEEKEPIYQGISIDGSFSDWDAVGKNQNTGDAALKSVAMVFDGDYVYLYIEETGDATNAGSHGNGMYAITTDLGRTTKIQLVKPEKVNGVNGAAARHVGSKWEISIPKSELAAYRETISFGLYLSDPIIKNVSNLDGSKGPGSEETESSGIVYDGLFGDWANYPHTIIQYATAGSSDMEVDAEGALYSSGFTLYGHVVTTMSAHLQEAGGEFTQAVTIQFNENWGQTIYLRFVTVDESGNINWSPQRSGLAEGKYEFYITSTDAWGISTNINQLNPADTMYGKMTISIGSTKDEMEYYIDLEKVAHKFNCDIEDFKFIGAQYGRLGQQWITTAGASTGAWVLLMLCLAIVWGYFLYVLKRAKLQSWYFLVGSLGLFGLLMLLGKEPLTMPFSRCVVALAGILGDLTNAYVAYFKYGIIFITTQVASITLQIDFECSGIIEIFAFLSLLIFFDMYSKTEKLILGIFGFVYIMLCNALRISMICFIVHFCGIPAYYVAHTFIGRIFFYVLSVILYFYVFTKPQIVRMKVGQFTYGIHQKTS